MLFNKLALSAAVVIAAARAPIVSALSDVSDLSSSLYGLPADLIDTVDAVLRPRSVLIERATHSKKQQCVVAHCTNAIPANAYRVCNKKGQCSFLCSSGFRWNGHACLPGKGHCKASECTNSIPCDSHRICKNGACDFGCNTGYHREYDQCKKDATTCTASSQCTRHRPAHSHVRCVKGACLIVCNDGYRKKDGACIPNDTKCDADECAPIKNGEAYCDAHGKCKYVCYRDQGYHLVGSGKSVRCINKAKDPNSCGKQGLVCPPDYNGIGKPKCTGGKCTLSCPPPTRVHCDPGMPAYCA